MPSLEQYANLFNWTMSYRLDADVVLPYSQFIDSETKAVISPSLKPAWRPFNLQPKPKSFQKIQKIVKGKTKLAAWFVSKCEAVSQRNSLVKQMQKYIPVDVYGKCGPLKCDDKRLCREMVQREYKFYMAFENTLCEDYVTEKVLEVMKYHVVPVVLGGADYTRFLPPGSYVNALDYESVEELVEYLKYLDRNEGEYMKFFWWKDSYKVIGPNFCGLCEKITNVGETPYFQQQYTDLEHWFKSNSCAPAEAFPLIKNAMEEFRGVNVTVL